MNYSKYNANFTQTIQEQTSISRKARLWLREVWQFSNFYGDYLASLHASKK